MDGTFTYLDSRKQTCPESRFISSVVFDDDKCTDPANEQAFILSELYHKAVEEHHQVIFWSLVVSIIFVFMGVITIVFGAMAGLRMGAITIGLIIIGALILIYGLFIHKPMKLISLSKIYTVSHIIPFESLLIIDGVGVIPDINCNHNNIPLDEVLATTQRLPKPPITFEKEKQLLIVLQEKHKLLKDVRQSSLLVPALLKDHTYTQAVLGCWKRSQAGEPSHGILDIKVDYQKALEYTDRIRFISGLRDSVSKINKDYDIMQEKVDPFLHNLESCRSNIDTHFNQIRPLLNSHFLSGINIHGDQKSDKLYGYGITPYKYHIPVGSASVDHIPISPAQHVINSLDNSLKDVTSTILSKGEKAVAQQKRECEDKTQEIKRRLDDQIDKLAIQIKEKEATTKTFSLKMETYKNQGRSCSKSARDYEKQANELRRQANTEYSNAYSATDNNVRDQFTKNARDYENRASELEIKAKKEHSNARIATDNAKNIKYEINNTRTQIDLLSSNISRLENDPEIERIKIKSKQEIIQLQNETKEEINKRRAHIDPIINARNTVIELMDRVTGDIILNEQDRHKWLFEYRLNNIHKLLNLNLSMLEDFSKERSEVLKQIDSIRINNSIDKPISIMIPYWIACFENKKETEFVILPLMKIQKPEKALKKWKTVSILTPLLPPLESSKHYLHKNNVYKKAISYSIYPGKLDPNISSSIDRLYKSGYLSKGVAMRMKKEYNLERGA